MIDAYIITGSLGTGKSTVLNHLLDHLPDDATPAVICHHFAMSFGLETTPVSKRRKHRKGHHLPDDADHEQDEHSHRHHHHHHHAAADEDEEASAAKQANVAFYEEVYDFGSGCICCSPKA